MAFERREYTGGAASTTLSADITNSATTFSVASGTGYPTGGTGNFVIVIGRGTASEEKILCSARSTNTFTVATGGRGYDGTTAAAHSSGDAVEHVISAVDMDEANRHYADTALDHHTQYLNTTRHDTTTRHSVGTVVPAATPGASAVGDTAAEGTATTAARSDHRHSREGFGTPGASAVGDTAAAGSATTVARSDHRHGREAFGSPVATGTANADGSATTPARSDHVHQLGNGSVNGQVTLAEQALTNFTSTQASTYETWTGTYTNTDVNGRTVAVQAVVTGHVRDPGTDAFYLAIEVSFDGGSTWTAGVATTGKLNAISQSTDRMPISAQTTQSGAVTTSLQVRARVRTDDASPQAIWESGRIGINILVTA